MGCNGFSISSKVAIKVSQMNAEFWHFNNRKSNMTLKIKLNINISRVYVESSSDGRGLDLIFRSLKESDEGEYACTATLDGRKEHRNVSLGIIGMKLLKLSFPDLDDKIFRCHVMWFYTNITLFMF